MTKIKPLTLAIRTLIGLSFVSPVRAELPVPSANVTLSNKPVEIATQGQATATISGQNLTIQQGSEKAVLNWQKFNIGAENAVNFQQPSANSVALNNIHQADASKIMGKLTANGQVYLVNQNGFVFGKDSQVNVNSLVASTLGISNDVFQKGIANAFNNDGSAALEGGNVVLKDATGNQLKDANGNPIKVEILIAKGANIKTNAANGRVIIAAPVITNEGNIETPDGQAILAASKDKVYLQEAGTDSSTRGLVVEVGKGGEVNNVGKVLAERGNASLLGFAVNQKGIVSATTSVKLNGSVRLVAHEGIQDKSATGGKLLPATTTRTEDENDGLGTNAKVTLSENSKTSVDLATDKTETAIDAQAQTPSNIEISAHDVIVQKNATIQAKSGNVSVEAIDNVNDPLEQGTARISLDENSNIDVSGVKDVALPVSKNIVTVETRKNELRDAPLQREGILYGKKVAVDIRQANVKRDTDGNVTSATIPVADIKGAVDRIERNIDERSTTGGKISLKSSGDVIAKAGSKVDFSGGSIKYQDGTIETTQLTSNGQAFAIEKADPNLKYDDIITQQYDAKGYVEGKAGGSLNIETYETKLDGSLKGETVSGIYQRDAKAVAGSSLAIDLSRNNLLSKQGVDFSESANNENLVLSPSNLKNSGISNIQIKTNGAVSLAKETNLNLPNFGSLAVAGKDFDIQGKISAPSGRVNFSPIKVDGNFLPSTLNLGESAKIDVSGFWVNDYADVESGKTLSQLALNGGSVSLQTEQGNLNLAKNSRIDVSGGAWLNGKNQIVSGSGGSISLTATSHDVSGGASSLLLNGTVQGYGATQGGSLNLTSNEVVISSTLPPLKGGGGDVLLHLNPEFFNQNGFANYSVNSYLGGLTVADNSQIKLQQQNVQFKSNANAQPTGSHLSDVSDVVTLPAEVRNPTNLTLSVNQTLSQNRNSFLTIGKEAQIQADRQATINFNSDTSILVNGKIDAPAGNINLTIEPPTTGDSGFFATQGIWLNENSQLSAKGDFKPKLNSLNLTMGDVLNGGNVNLTAKRGYVVTNPKSIIDVSGTQKELDFVQVENGGQQFIKQTIPSSGGTIQFKAGEGIVADGQLLAKGVVGGTLNVELNSNLRSKPDVAIESGLFPDDVNATLDRIIEIRTNSHDLTAQSGRAFFRNQRLNDAGFAALNFKTDVINANGDYAGGVLFNGDVTLNAQEKITLDTPQIQTTGGKVILYTAYAALGSTQSRLDTDLGDGNFSTTLAPDSIRGDGKLTISAKNIDLIGGLSFKNFNNVNLNSENDLRVTGIRVRSDSKNYLGELKLDGDLTLSASQVYPSTLSDYKFSIAGDDSTVTIQNSGAAPSPVYSAAGNLTINAANIIQSGTLKAPFGNLNLNATNKLELTDGSTTSVSGDGVTVPFGRGSGGNWLYPFDDTGSVALVIDTPPEKRLALSGKEVLLDKGANVNLKGGGDLYAYEFVAGIGGSKDVLKTNSSEKFAVMPDLGHALTPNDPLESTDSTIKVGDSVYLNAADGLKAGWYTILPAHYALLPNAYLVTPLANTQDWSPNQTAKNLAGTSVVAGRYGNANADIKNPRWQGFAVESGKVARTYSEYTDYFANDFFAEKAAKAIESVSQQLPQDAGDLILNAQTRLTLNANLFALPENKGKGSFVDISANNLAIVSRREDVASGKSDVVSLFVDDLNNLNAPSLLLGGTRSKNKNGQVVTVSTQNLTIAQGAKLKGSELLLAATDSLKVSAGAQIQSIGKSNPAPQKLELITNKQITETATDDFGIETENVFKSGDSAFLRVSSAGQSALIHTGKTTGETGVLTVEKGAILQSENSMLLDASKDTIFAGDIKMDGGSLSLNASKISLGNAPENTDGLVLASPKFTLDELKLNSRSSLDIYGSVDLKTKELLFDSAAIRGFDNSGKTATVTTDNLTLSNSHQISDFKNGTGSGSLDFNSKNIQFGSGDYAISGFQNVNFNASETIKGLGQSFDSTTGKSVLSNPANIRIFANVNANSPQITSENGATTNIDATGFDVKLNSTSLPPSKGGGGDVLLGGLWNIQADKIDSSAQFNLPSGVLKLHAQKGDVTLNNGSVDVSGREIQFGSAKQNSPAGKIELSAVGNVTLENSAQLNTGSLNVSVPQGQFVWNGKVNAPQGSFELNANNLGDFSTLNSKIATAGFSEKIDLTQNSGNVTIAANDKIKANEFNLSANQGNVAVNGAIDAKDVTIRGNDGVSLAGKIVATNVTLDTVHQNDTESGLLDLSAKGSIDAKNLHLRTGRNDDAKTVNVSPINTTIKSENAVLEATRVYENQSDINSETIAQFQTDTANFMNVAPHLQNNSGAKISLAAGIELRSEGDLTLSSTWDFASKNTNEETGATTPNWRFDDGQGNKNVAGFLTLNAKGDVLINASLTDAFADGALPNTDPENIYPDVLQSGASWSYKIAAGKDVKLANAYYPLDEYGEPAYDPSQVVVRTGTGSIDISVKGNIEFVKDAENAKASAAIYTAGKPAEFTKTQLLNGEIAGIPAKKAGESEAQYLNRLDANQMNALLRYGYVDENLIGLQFRVAEYPTQGGSISLNAGKNISGIDTGQEISDWLVRSGVISENNRPTAWGINLSGDSANSDKGVHFFNQNIGALGGGDVSINAGGDILNLSAMLPTTGKPFGKISEESSNQSTQTGTVINGGGNLTINASNNIVGGEYFVALGTANVNAGGSVLGSGESNLGALVQLGDANYNISARQNIVIGSVFNPTVLKQNVLLPNRIGESRFFTYGENSGVSLSSIAGNISLQNDISAIKAAKGHDSDSETGFEYAVYPESLKVSALSGDINLDHSMTLFPSTNGKLELLAGNNVGVDETAGQVISVNMSDADAAFLPSIQNPTQQMEGSLSDGLIRTREYLDASTPNPRLIHAEKSLYLNNDNTPKIIAKSGNIAFSSNSDVTFFLPKAAEFSAGQDIQNLHFSGQNLNTSDITTVSAGRDITFDAIVDENGNVQANDKQFELAGAGELKIQAGRNISLGGSAGINTIGNTKNTVLPSEGASISLIAGSTQTADKNALTSLFETIKTSAANAAAVSDADRKAIYQKGFDAIDFLFPKTAQAASGDLSLVFSQIKTLAGGDINLAVPNGEVNVGLAGSLGGIKKGADKLGIVVQQSGDLNAFSSGNFNVNQSRVFTMGGGDIAIWSSQGNIDAGKGAKSAISAPAPITSIDSQGNIVTIFPPVVSGSGIQTITPQQKNAKQGNVYLAAPSGIVDAGEAGISGGKIVIAANAVVGASNISASSGSVGVPTSVPAPSVSGAASSAAASAAKSATQMNDETNNPNSNQDNSTKPKKKTVVSFLSTDIIGYGNCSPADIRDGKEGCGN